MCNIINPTFPDMWLLVALTVCILTKSGEPAFSLGARVMRFSMKSDRDVNGHFNAQVNINK